MTQIKVAISAKNLQAGVNYNNPYTILNNENILFPIQNLKEEVCDLSKKEQNKLKQICNQLLITSSAFLTMAKPTMAATTNHQMINGSDILTGGLWIIGIMATAGFILAIVLLQSAAGYKMIFKKKKKVANDWSLEIVRGFIQIMLAPAIIMTIALVMYLLFGNLNFFVSPFQMN